MKQKINFNPLLKGDSLLSSKYQNKSSINHLDRNLIPYEKWSDDWKRIYYKEYPRFPKIVLKTKPSSLRHKSILAALEDRSSEREYTANKKVEYSEVSNLLRYSSGINTHREVIAFPKRFIPSGGMRFPNEIYILVNNNKVKNLKQFSYHYNIKRNCLEEMFLIKDYEKLASSIYVHDWVAKSAMIICISAVFNRSRVKYGERGYRFCLIEAGHIGQNISLISAGMGLKCCALGGFSDHKINSELELNANEESVLYLFAIGK